MMSIFGARLASTSSLFWVHRVLIVGFLLAIAGCDQAADRGGKKALDSVEAAQKIKDKAEKISLRGEPKTVGQKYRATESIVMSNGKMSMTVDWEQIQGTMESTSRKITEYQLASANERSAIIIEAVEEQTTMMMGQSRNESKKNVLVGKPLSGTRQDSAWVYALVNGDPTEEEIAELAAMNNPDGNELYPKKAVKIGDTFKIKSEQMKALLTDAITRDLSGSGRGKLEELVDYEGQRCARISLGIDARGLREEDGEEMQITIKAEGEVLRSLEIFENLKVDMKGTISFGGETETTPGQPISVSVTADLLFTFDTEFL